MLDGVKNLRPGSSSSSKRNTSSLSPSTEGDGDGEDGDKAAKTDEPVIPKPKRHRSTVGVMKVATEISQLSKMDDVRMSKWTLRCDSRTRHVWDFGMVFAILYNLISVPVYTGFARSPTGILIFVDIAVDLMFMLDVAINLVTTYYEDKEHVTTGDRIRAKYFGSNFWPDMRSAVPVFLISIFVDHFWGLRGSDQLTQTGWVQALIVLQMIIRTRRAKRAAKFVNTMNELSGGNPTLVRMLECVVAFMLVVHFIACGYFRVSYEEDFGKWKGMSGSGENQWVNGNVLWTADAGVDEAGNPAPVLGDPVGNGWTIDNRFAHDDLAIAYAHTLYFALVMMAGDTIDCETTTEVLFTSVCFLLHFAVTATIIGTATNVLSNMDMTQQLKKRQIDGVQDYMRYRKVPVVLQRKILSYYEYLWETGQVAYNEALFEELPDKLRLELNLTLKQRLIQKVPIFRLVNPAGIIALVQNLRPCIVLPEELVVRQGEKADCMFFMSRGSVSIERVNDEGPTSYIQTLKEGAYFGEIALLDPSAPLRTANVVAVTFCELQVLHADDFFSMLVEFPDFKLAIDKVAQVRMKATSNIAKLYKRGQFGIGGTKKTQSKAAAALAKVASQNSPGNAAATSATVNRAAKMFKKGLRKNKTEEDEEPGMGMSHELAIQFVQQQGIRLGSRQSSRQKARSGV